MSETIHNCPACGTRASVSVGGRGAGFSFKAGDRVFEHPSYGIYRCATCDLHFKSDRVDDAELGAYYAHLEFESFESEALMPPDRLIVAEAATIPAGRRILDFGCGVGRSLAASVGRLDCFGVEPNARAAEVARARGIHIITEGALHAGGAGEFDMIVMSDVYEHMTRPREEILGLARCLPPGGRMVLVTGAIDYVQPAELLPEFWYFRAPGHLHMASQRHLEWLAGSTGLALERTQFLSHYDGNPVRDTLQGIKLWAYARTHLEPHGAAATLVRAIPVIRRAATWGNAPAWTGGRDHVFAVLAKTESRVQ